MSGLIVKIDPDDLSIEPVARSIIIIINITIIDIIPIINFIFIFVIFIIICIRIGSNCNEQHEESKCGRPLGMVFTKVSFCYSLYADDQSQYNEESW